VRTVRVGWRRPHSWVSDQTHTVRPHPRLLAVPRQGGGGKRRHADVDLTFEDLNDDPSRNPYAFSAITHSAENFEAFVANDLPYAELGGTRRELCPGGFR
jgi:hypothetical protein